MLFDEGFMIIRKSNPTTRYVSNIFRLPSITSGSILPKGIACLRSGRKIPFMYLDKIPCVKRL